MSETSDKLDHQFHGFRFGGILIPQEAIEAAEATRPSLRVPPVENVDEATAIRIAEQISGLSRSERQSRFQAVQELRDRSDPQVEG